MMPTEKTAAPAPIPPVEVTVIGTPPSTGAPLTTGTVGATPDHQPNLVVNVVAPIVAILVRFANLFATTWLGLVMAGMTPAGGKLLGAGDFAHLAVVCASLALPGAAVGLVKDLITVFGRLESKYPLMTGSI